MYQHLVYRRFEYYSKLETHVFDDLTCRLKLASYFTIKYFVVKTWSLSFSWYSVHLNAIFLQVECLTLSQGSSKNDEAGFSDFLVTKDVR